MSGIEISIIALSAVCVLISLVIAHRNAVIKSELERTQRQLMVERYYLAEHKTYKDKYESLLTQHHAYVESSMATMRSVREMNEQIVALNERIEELRSNEY